MISRIQTIMVAAVLTQAFLLSAIAEQRAFNPDRAGNLHCAVIPSLAEVNAGQAHVSNRGRRHAEVEGLDNLR